jgi:hypothetical protein
VALTRGILRFAAAAAAGLGLALGALIGLNVLAARHAPRWDVTSTGTLRLAPRTTDVLERCPPGSEIVLAADLSSGARDPGAVRRVLDILDEVGRAGRGLTVSVIDTGSGAGVASFDALLGRMIERDGGAIGGARDALSGSAESLGVIAAALPGLAAELDTIGPSLARSASVLRVTGERAGPALDNAGRMLTAAEPGALPDLHSSRRMLIETAAAIRSALTAAAGAIEPSAPLFSGDVAARAAEALDRARSLAERAGECQGTLEVQALPASARVAAALRSGEALLVFGPDGAGMTGVPVDELFPSLPGGEGTIDAGRRTEALVAGALSQLDGSPKPLVVLTHAGTGRVLHGGGVSPFSSLERRSALRGIDWVEWPVAVEPEPPAAIAAARADGRPVVHALVGIDTSSAGGAERAARAAGVLTRLLEAGEPVLVSLAPSTLPGLGEPDPMAAAIAPLGLDADTGRPILRERARGSNRLVEWELLVVGGAGDRPVASTLRGLSTLVPWALLIEGERTDSRWPVLSVERVEGAWRDGEWLGYWLTPPTQRPLLVEKPAPGGVRDTGVGDGAIAWAVDRGASGRAIVIGSHLWFLDQTADRGDVIDGRFVPTAPGNGELFLASVAWLAGQDHALSPGVEAVQTPTVQPMEPARLSAVRWALTGGVPLLLLAAGVAWRLVRG